MKTRPTRDTAQEMPATQSTNSSAPSPATMTSSSPSVKNRQTGDQKRARYGQARDLLAYQRHAQINKLNTVKKAEKAEKARKTEKTDIPRTTTPDNRWDRFTNAVNPSGLFILRRANELSELVAWLSTSPTSLRELIISDAYLDTTCVMALADIKDVTALADALRVNTTLRSLTLSLYIEHTDGIKALADALRVNTTLTTLDFSDSCIGDYGAVVLADALQVNKTLTTLGLGRIDIGADGATALAGALQVNATLTTLGLGGNDIGADGATVLADALQVNTTLATLDLSDNDIGADGATTLADALQVNTTLTTLALYGNNIGDTGAAVLADVLKVNRTLTALALYGNNIGDTGAAALADTLTHNTTLTRLDLGYIQDWNYKINGLLEKNRRLKLQPYAEASLDLLVRYSPELEDMDGLRDVLPLVGEHLSTEVMAIFEQEWQDAFRAPPPPITTTTTNTTTTTTTATTTDSTAPTTLTTSPAPIVTSPASVPPLSTQPITTAPDINALLADPNPVVSLSRWIDEHANPTTALNWVDPVNGYTLLHYAVEAQQGAVVRSLLARGIDSRKADHNNQTAAQLAQRRADSSSSQAVAAIAALFK